MRKPRSPEMASLLPQRGSNPKQEHQPWQGCGPPLAERHPSEMWGVIDFTAINLWGWLIDAISWGEVVVDFSGCSFSCFSYLQISSWFSSSTHLSLLLALNFFLSLAGGSVPNRFSWLSKIFQRTALLVNVSLLLLILFPPGINYHRTHWNRKTWSK